MSVAVVIPAKDEAERIGATVAGALGIKAVDLVVVVDDGSSDDTKERAERAGARVVRHPRNRGKAAAMDTGAHAVAMAGDPERLLLFLDGDLGASAAHAEPLVGPVLSGAADMAIALLPPQATPGGGRGRVVRLARGAIERETGWRPTQPLAGIRCLTQPAFAAGRPLAKGWGVETGLTLDLLSKGFRVVEVPCDLHHRVTGTDLAGKRHRAEQFRDVLLLLARRRARKLLRR